MLRLLLVLSCLCWVTGLKRVCYYDSLARYRKSPNSLPASSIDPNVCTHLIFAFIGLDNTTFQFTPDAPGDEEEYRPFTDLKLRNPNLVTMLAVGGWEMGTAPFLGLVETTNTMTSFANGTVTFLRKYGFDGIDIDWEFPGIEDRGGSPEDKQKFPELLRILRETFDNEPLQGNRKKLVLSAAVATHGHYIQQSYDVAEIAKNVDFINMMLYDFHGDWDGVANVHSALYSNADDMNIDAHVRSWIAEGAPPAKLMLGVPFYGRTYTLTNTSDQSVGASSSSSDGGFIPYFQICETIQQRHLQEHVLTTERVPYIVFDDQWVGYDNRQSLEEKARYAVKMGMGGVMVWSLSLDDTSGTCGQGSYPLMRAINTALSPDVGPIGK